MSSKLQLDVRHNN